MPWYLTNLGSAKWLPQGTGNSKAVLSRNKIKKFTVDWQLLKCAVLITANTSDDGHSFTTHPTLDILKADVHTCMHTLAKSAQFIFYKDIYVCCRYNPTDNMRISFNMKQFG